ncbi:MAG: CtsR family transcriptional regulator [Synergistaceae bacterium]|nr:CtsR family transcriptional regulator [Synergistaceae bacterium]
MNNLTREIEKYLLALLDEAENEDFIQLRRKELAETFDCVPSQINYVLRSRFSPEQGYLIESRRGGSGYIKILKISCSTSEEKNEHLSSIIGDSISINEAKRLLEYLQNRELITARERLLIEIALKESDSQTQQNNIQPSERGEMHADLLRNMLTSLI